MKWLNVKTLSYISAWLQLSLSLFFIIFFSTSFALSKENYNKWLASIYIVVMIIVSSLFVTLLVGIKQNRLKLVSIFMYAAHTLFAIGIIYLIYEFVMGFVHKEEIANIFLDLLLECAVLGIEILLTTPIHKLHNKMHHCSSEDQHTDSKEQYGLSTNEPVHKPNYEL